MRKSQAILYSNLKIKNYSVTIDGRNFLDHPVKNDLNTYSNIRKIRTGKGDNYTTGCLLGYPYLKNYYKLIATDISKQRKLDADPKGIRHINLTGNLDQKVEQCFSFLKKQKEPLDFSKGTVKVL